jgi:hypothetical protein
MPNRLLREGILESKAVCSLSEGAELFYRRLMSIVDDYGRFESDVEVLRARLFPRNLDRWPLTRVRKMLTECCQMLGTKDEPLITVYEDAKTGKEYLQINNFGQRQRTESKCPAPPSLTNVSRPRSSAAHARGRSESEAESEAKPEAKPQSETCAEAKPVADALRLLADADPDKPPEVRSFETPPPIDIELDLWVEAAYLRHPKKAAMFESKQALHETFRGWPELRKIFDRHHEHMCRSPDWLEKHGRFAPKLCDWIWNDGWRSPPEGLADADLSGSVRTKSREELL